MSDHKGVSVFCDMGFNIPDGYLIPMTKLSSNVYGIVSRKNSDTTDLSITTVDKQATLDHLKQINKAMEGFRTVQFVGSFPDGYLKDSIQPFRLLLNSAGQCIVAATFVGDFKKHLPASNSSKHSAEWWCANNELLPKLQQIWRLTKGDYSAFHSELRDMETEIKKLIGLQGGLITLVLAKPDDTVVMQMMKSLPTFHKYPWGTVSDTLGYVTGIETPTEIVEKPKKKKFVVSVSETDDEKPKEEEKKDVPIIVQPEKQIVLKSGATVTVTTVDGKTVHTWYPPQLITKHKPLRALYKEASGRTPSNHEMDNRVGVILKNLALLKEVDKSLASLSVLAATSTTSDAPRSKEPPKTEEKTPEVQEIAESVKAEDEAAKLFTSVHEDRKYPEGGTPIYSSMSPKQKYDVNKYLKALDKNGQSIVNPVLDQELEDTTPQFYKDIGYDGLEQTFGWKFKERVELAKLSPEAMAIWSGDLLRCIKNLNKDIESLTDPDVMKRVAKAQEEVGTLTYKPRKRA